MSLRIGEPVRSDGGVVERRRVDVVFCTPGHPSSKDWQIGFDRVKRGLEESGVVVGEASAVGPDVIAVRNKCLSDREKPGFRVDQVPFGGKYRYGRICWLDSDSHIKVGDVDSLMRYDVPVVGGWSKLEPRPGEGISDGNEVSCGYLGEDGFPVAYTMKTLMGAPRDDRGLVEVWYTGLPFTMFKEGVFEKLGYPWFRSWVHTYKDREGVECAESLAEDAALCSRLRDLKVPIYIDPKVRVGHAKMLIL